MNQAPVNYYPQMVQPQPYQPQLSYNAVKIDVHNPKVMDGPCPPMMSPAVNQPQSAYNMPYNPYYTYPQNNTAPYYYVPAPVYQPQSQPCTNPINGGQQPVQMPPQVPQGPVTPNTSGQIPQPVPVVVPAPVPVVPTSQQVINNGIPASQVITQNPQTQPGQQIINPAPVNNMQNTKVETQAPEKSMPAYDITPVLRGLQSNNMAEQADALNKIGEVAENPNELKHYLEPAVLDSLLAILHADTKGLEGPTKEQEAARDKWMKEKDLPEKDQTLTPQERQLAMTLAPSELADKNKQFAMYSISILQKALADEIEKTNGEKISIEKLPAIDHIVNVLKSNPNPVLRASAIVALAHLNKEDYKPVLTDIFKLAQKDEDPNVQQVAGEALERINLPEAPKN